MEFICGFLKCMQDFIGLLISLRLFDQMQCIEQHVIWDKIRRVANFDTFYRICILCVNHEWRWNSVFRTLFSVTICQKYPFCSLVSWQNTFLLVFLKQIIWMFRCCPSCILIDYMQQVPVGLIPSGCAQDITLGQGNVPPFHILSSSLPTFSGETSPLCSVINRIYIYIYIYISQLTILKTLLYYSPYTLNFITYNC